MDNESGSQQSIVATSFAAAIAVILLLLWGGTLLFMIIVVQCESSSGCTSPVIADITSGMITVSATIGGLVSALVVARLAITDPGQNPGGAVLSADASGRAKRVADILAALYLSVWIVIGLAALIFGVLIYPDKVETLTTTGNMWLGVAVAASYSYFGLRKSNSE